MGKGRVPPNKAPTYTPEPLPRPIRIALLGIFLGLFVGMFSSTVIASSMPVIMGELGGSQTALTLVVIAALLTSAVTAPIWGKLADLTDKVRLYQISLLFFCLGTLMCGFATSSETLIIWRLVQGIGGGGFASLAQIIMADIISPRDRGKYMGYASAVMSVGSISGPLIGGLVTDVIDWRWNFFLTIPLALTSIALMHFVPRIPRPTIKFTFDYLGAFLTIVTFSALLIWLSFGGTVYRWTSVTSLIMASAIIFCLLLLAFVEIRSRNPILPVSLFRNPSFVYAALATFSVGIALYSSILFFSQFLQLAQNHTPFESAVLTIPMLLGTFISSIVSGNYVTLTGHWKRTVIFGSACSLSSMVVMSQSHADTPYPLIACIMFVLGAGIGMTMQNLMLVVQNVVSPHSVGQASSVVTFIRALGGTIGITVMGLVVSTQIVTILRRDISSLGPERYQKYAAYISDQIPVIESLPSALVQIFTHGYGEAVAHSFYVPVPFAFIALISVVLLPNIPLGTQTVAEQLRKEQEDLNNQDDQA